MYSGNIVNGLQKQWRIPGNDFDRHGKILQKGRSVFSTLSFDRDDCVDDKKNSRDFQITCQRTFYRSTNYWTKQLSRIVYRNLVTRAIPPERDVSQVERAKNEISKSFTTLLGRT